MTNYTAEQIREAIREINGMSSEWTVSEIVVWKYKKFIDALPDQPDDWQECSFDEIRKGDRVKRVRRDNFGTIETVEGIVGDLTDDAAWDKSLRKLLAGKRVDHSLSLYRIPTPVVHPVPAEHPVIIVHESTVLPKGSEPQKTIFIRPHYRNDIWNGAPDTITEWEPASIVPKVVEDDR